MSKKKKTFQRILYIFSVLLSLTPSYVRAIKILSLDTPSLRKIKINSFYRFTERDFRNLLLSSLSGSLQTRNLHNVKKSRTRKFYFQYCVTIALCRPSFFEEKNRAEIHTHTHRTLGNSKTTRQIAFVTEVRS